MKAYLINYFDEFEKLCGIEQLKEFTQYRIEVANDEFKKDFIFEDFNNLTEKECLSILKLDGYEVMIYEIY